MKCTSTGKRAGGKDSSEGKVQNGSKSVHAPCTGDLKVGQGGGGFAVITE